MSDDGGMFPQHPKTGDWETLKGSMLAPHEAGPIEAGNTGDARFNGEAGNPNWESSLKPHEGMTRGTGTGTK